MSEYLSMFGESSDDSETEESDRRSQSRATSQVEATSLHYAEVKEVSGIGGGRGIFAKTDLPPGCLIFSEISSMTFRDAADLDDPAEFLYTVEQVCKDAKAFECCKVLHPVSIDDVPQEDVEAMKMNWNGDSLLTLASKLHCPRDEIVRVGLALQHNGFASGLYHTLTKLNHSCSPNCIKFKPTAQSKWASEIWTVRDIAKGEELSICYCEPMEMTSQSMREYLLAQHRFSCLCELCSSLQLTTASSKDKDTSSLLELDKKQETIAMLEGELRFISLEEHTDALRICKKMMKVGEETMLASFNELLSRPEADTETGTREREGNGLLGGPGPVLQRSLSVIKMRVLKLLVQVAATSIQAYSQTKGVKRSVLEKAIYTYVGASHSLMHLQTELLGPDHSDLSTTQSDLAEGIRCVLTHAGTAFSMDEALTHLRGGPYALHVADASELRTVMGAAEREAKRLKALYNTHAKYPEAFRALKEPGDLFIGGVHQGQVQE